MPEIKYNKDTGNYEIGDVKGIVAFNDNNYNDKVEKSTMIHELCHAIKSANGEYEINGDILINRSGLIEKYYKLSIDENGTVTKSLMKETGVGMEEGFTSLQQEKISRKVFDDENYKLSGYASVRQMARVIDGLSPEIHDIIIEAQTTHDKTKLISAIGEQNYNNLLYLFDKFYELDASAMSIGAEKYGEEIDKLVPEWNRISDNI